MAMCIKGERSTKSVYDCGLVNCADEGDDLKHSGTVLRVRCRMETGQMEGALETGGRPFQKLVTWAWRPRRGISIAAASFRVLQKSRPMIGGPPLYSVLRTPSPPGGRFACTRLNNFLFPDSPDFRWWHLENMCTSRANRLACWRLWAKAFPTVLHNAIR